MRVVVTGASGFLGSHIVGCLREAGLEVIGFSSQSLDIRSPVVLPRAGAIIHAAANPRVYLAKREVYEDFRINVLGTLNLLEAARKAGIPKFIFISSDRVYTNRWNPREEDPVGPGSGGGPYGVGKITAENYVRQYSECYGISHVIFRPSSLYGPRMYKNSVADMIRGFLDGERIRLFLHEDSEVDFLYVKDAAKAVVMALGWENALLNLSSGAPERLARIYGLLKDIFGRSVPLDFQPEVVRTCTDSTKLRSLGWRPEVPMEDGLRKTTEFFKAARKGAR